MMMKNGDESRKGASEKGTQTRYLTLWRCTTCGGLNKTDERPELCELCGEGKEFEKMQLRIKTRPKQDP